MNHIKRLAAGLACALIAAALLGCSRPAADVSTPAPTLMPTPAPFVPAAQPPPPAAPDALEGGSGAELPVPAATPLPSATRIPSATPEPDDSEPAAAQVSIASLVKQFEVSADKYYNSYGFSTNRYSYTQQELTMLAIVIHLEARGESYRTKLAVGNVVMNRVLASGYPGGTIAQVVTAPNQFCYNASVTPNADCVRAARDVLDYQAWVVPQNTYFFRDTGSTGNWGSHAYYKHFDGMAFYRENYGGRYGGSAVPARLYERTYRWPQYGCKPGARVRKIQMMLKKLGYDVDVDGYFGLDTREQVIAFQKANRLTADGVAGPRTLTALIKAYGTAQYLSL